MDALHVVVLDDDPIDRLLARRALVRAPGIGAVDDFGDRDTYRRVLEAGDFDVFVTDYKLGWTTGVDVLHDVKSRWPDRPVLMFTGTGDEELVAAAMQEGLDDYVVKSARHPARLAAAVQRSVERSERRVESARLAARLEDLLARLDVGVYWSRGGRVLACNATFQTLAGCDSPEAVCACALEEWFPLTRGADLLPGGAARRQALCRRDGTRLWVDVETALLPDGTTAGLVRDADEHHRVAQAALDAIHRERERLSAEMHDGLGQHLAGLALLVASGQRYFADAGEEGRDFGVRLAEVVAGAQEECRSIAHGYAADVMMYGLRNALRKLADQTTEAGVPCVLDAPHDVDERVPAWVAHEVYRVLQEAVTNVLRHASAKRMVMKLAVDARGLRAAVRDDGIGARAADECEGLGLRTMRFRAEQMGGTLAVRSAAGRGTEVVLAVGPAVLLGTATNARAGAASPDTGGRVPGGSKPG